MLLNECIVEILSKSDLIVSFIHFYSALYTSICKADALKIYDFFYHLRLGKAVCPR